MFTRLSLEPSGSPTAPHPGKMLNPTAKPTGFHVDAFESRLEGTSPAGSPQRKARLTYCSRGTFPSSRTPTSLTELGIRSQTFFLFFF